MASSFFDLQIAFLDLRRVERAELAAAHTLDLGLAALQLADAHGRIVLRARCQLAQ